MNMLGWGSREKPGLIPAEVTLSLEQSREEQPGIAVCTEMGIISWNSRAHGLALDTGHSTWHPSVVVRVHLLHSKQQKT